jgi:hypothetical protein
MRQVILAVAALAGVLLFSYNGRKMAHLHSVDTMRGEVTMEATTLGTRLLDFAGSLSVVDPVSRDSLMHIEQAGALDDLDGAQQAYVVPMEGGTITLDVTVEVEPVEKQADEYIPAPSTAPFRRVAIEVAGPLGVRVVLDRIYARHS